MPIRFQFALPLSVFFVSLVLPVRAVAPTCIMPCDQAEWSIFECDHPYNEELPCVGDKCIFSFFKIDMCGLNDSDPRRLPGGTAVASYMTAMLSTTSNTVQLILLR